jgi:hypothetical protein
MILLFWFQLSLGYRGLLDDILVLIVAYAYISAAYRDILIARQTASTGCLL